MVIMSKFVVLYKLKKRKGFTGDLAKNHVEHLRNLSRKNVLFLCGRLKGDGAMLILEAKSLKEAEAYILQDPVIIQKNYCYDIYELVEANESNNFLLK
jgi:uncharacterized protein YciI